MFFQGFAQVSESTQTWILIRNLVLRRSRLKLEVQRYRQILKRGGRTVGPGGLIPPPGNIFLNP